MNRLWVRFSLYIGLLVVVGVVNRFGSNATAAYGAVNQVLSYIQFPAMSIAIATSIFTVARGSRPRSCVMSNGT